MPKDLHVEIVDQAVLLQRWDEFRGGERAAVGIVPSGERLRRDDHSGDGREDRLEAGPDAALRQGFGEVADDVALIFPVHIDIHPLFAVPRR